MIRQLLLLSALLFFCFTATASAWETAYTRYNIWREPHSRVWAINYKRGEMLPAGTEVRDVRINTGGFNDQYISFNRVSDGKLFHVYFRSKFHPGKTIADYRRFMFSNYPFSVQTNGMSDREIDAISRGVLVTGMSKKAVTMAYGIPPQHKTPNLNSNRWRYWTSRMVWKDICFSAAGRTIRCQQPDTL